MSNDFVLSGEGGDVELLQRDIEDWRITFVDTGLNANVGQRLRAVRKHVGDETFLANYGDILTDAPLDELVERFLAGERDRLVPVRPAPSYSFHIVRLADDGPGRPGSTTSARPTSGSTAATSSSGRRSSTTSAPGEELVEEPFARLIEAGQLQGDPYEGFWAPMDTLKDVQALQTRLRHRAPAVGDLAAT